MSEEKQVEVYNYDFNKDEISFLVEMLDKTSVVGTKAATMMLVMRSKLIKPLQDELAEKEDNKDEATN